MARQRLLPRVLPRRQRGRARREPPDRVDGTDRRRDPPPPRRGAGDRGPDPRHALPGERGVSPASGEESPVLKARPGNRAVLGATMVEGGVNFAVASTVAET